MLVTAPPGWLERGLACVGYLLSKTEHRMTAMDSLHRLVGHEQDFDHVCHTLRHCVDRLNPAVVGALHVTCSDESERECIEAFQKAFVEPRLPSLKLWSKCAFRTSNLGGRYEWDLFSHSCSTN